MMKQDDLLLHLIAHQAGLYARVKGLLLGGGLEERAGRQAAFGVIAGLAKMSEEIKADVVGSRVYLRGIAEGGVRLLALCF
jgi:hypothetical protein